MNKVTSAKDIAKRYGVHIRTVDNWRRLSKLPCYPVGNHFVFIAEEVEEWIASNRPELAEKALA